MPELPEVETIVRDLDRLVRSALIVEVDVLRPDLLEGVPPDEFAAALRGKTIRGVGRRAKNIVFDFGPDRLVVNLGMTGRIIVAGPDDSQNPHPGVRFGLEDGRELRYNDSRRFGRLQRFDSDGWRSWERRLGPEPLGEAFTPEGLHALTRGSRVAIKSWLMDQRRVVGIGNIYASEALFRAGLHPQRPARSLSEVEAARLHTAIREVLDQAIRFRGTTLLDYRDATGERGGFRERLRVYDRRGESCPVCAAPVERIVQGGRSTFFCMRCQS